VEQILTLQSKKYYCPRMLKALYYYLVAINVEILKVLLKAVFLTLSFSVISENFLHGKIIRKTQLRFLNRVFI